MSLYDFFEKKKPLSPPTVDDYIAKPHHGRIEVGRRHRRFFNKKSEDGKPLVSIITAVYNGKKYLEHTIQSVINQTYSSIEYVIIDGGSTDGTLDIIRKYDNKIACWVSEPDEGISDAFNKGISFSTGDIIGIINSDDWYESDTVEKVIKRYLDCKPDILHGIVRRGDELIVPDEAMLKYEMSINHPATFATRHSYLKIGLFRTDFRYAMDYEWLLRGKGSDMKFSFINQCIANMRTGGISDRRWKTVLREWLKAQNFHYTDRIVFNYLFFIFQVIKGTVGRLFKKIGLHGLVKFYHEQYSRVKKTGVAG